MREIKFRAWDKKRNRLVEVVAINFYFYYEEIVTKDITKEITIPFEDCILMQYTDIQDKNCVEIYEGDIIRIVSEGINVSVYSVPGGWGVQEFHREVGTPSEHYIPLGDLSSYYCIKDGIEVIGNIFENPELLKIIK